MRSWSYRVVAVVMGAWRWKIPSTPTAVVAPVPAEDAQLPDVAREPLRMSSEWMHVGAWIVPLDPVESRQCSRAVLRGETTRVVERSPRMADGRRPGAGGWGRTGRVLPPGCRERRT